MVIERFDFHTVKTQIIEPCALKSEIPFSGIAAKTQQKTQPLPPAKTEKKENLTLLGEESPRTYGSIIQFSTVYTPLISISLASKPSTQNRPILLAIIILPPTVAHTAPYLLLFCLQISTAEHPSSGLWCIATRKW